MGQPRSRRHCQPHHRGAAQRRDRRVAAYRRPRHARRQRLVLRPRRGVVGIDLGDCARHRRLRHPSRRRDPSDQRPLAQGLRHRERQARPLVRSEPGAAPERDLVRRGPRARHAALDRRERRRSGHRRVRPGDRRRRLLADPRLRSRRRSRRGATAPPRQRHRGGAQRRHFEPEPRLRTLGAVVLGPRRQARLERGHGPPAQHRRSVPGFELRR